MPSHLIVCLADAGDAEPGRDVWMEQLVLSLQQNLLRLQVSTNFGFLSREPAFAAAKNP
jgi:hypothetical protein